MYVSTKYPYRYVCILGEQEISRLKIWREQEISGLITIWREQEIRRLGIWREQEISFKNTARQATK